MSNVLAYANIGKPKKKTKTKKKVNVRNLKYLRKAMMAKRGGKR